MPTPHLAESSRPQSELDALLLRIRRCLYPENLPVAGSYWLKTAYQEGHKRAWWKKLDQLLTKALSQELPDSPSHQVLSSVHAWIRQSAGLLAGKTTVPGPAAVESLGTNLDPDRLAPYLGRLLNEWLPAEVAYMLVDESDRGRPEDSGIPVLAMAKALERLLLRERLSPGTLEMLLDPQLLSPRYIYPAHAEILQDVVFALLGRTAAPVPCVMPATLLGVAAEAALPRNYADAVGYASLVQGADGEQIHVPIAAGQAAEILKGDPVRIASIIVTMDGRWWEAASLQSGDWHSVVYRPGGRLRIDDTEDHARLHVPWPETQLRWTGASPFQKPFELFGREWHVSRWEAGGERTWLHLVFSRVLAVPAAHPTEERFHRLRPAFVDMAWSAVGNALAAALRRKDREPIEQLRRAELIPLGRALFGLAESVSHWRQAKRETIETQLRGVRYLEGEVSPVYGRVPWGVLPAQVRTAFLKTRPDSALLDLLNEVFDSVPEALRPVTRREPAPVETTHSTSPSQAA